MSEVFVPFPQFGLFEVYLFVSCLESYLNISSSLLIRGRLSITRRT